MRPIVLAYVASRVALVIVLLASIAFMPDGACPSCVDPSTNSSANPLLAGLSRWDGDPYVDIARHGYEGAERATHGAYSPLYPALMRVGGLVLGGSVDAYIVAGVLISNAALLFALRSLLLLATPRIGLDAGRRAVIYVLVFPTTIVLSAVYADALFLALAITSAVEAQRGRWWRSGLFATLAALTRPFGALAVIPLAVALWQARGRAPITTWLAASFAPFAFLAWAAYLYAISGDPLRVMHVYAAWGSAPRSPLQAFTDLFDPAIYGFPWFVLSLIVIFAVLVVASWRMTGPGLGAYATAAFLVLASSGSLTSSMRYELSIYPAFIVLGAVTARPWAHVAWMAASAIVALIFTAMFVLWFWVG